MDTVELQIGRTEGKLAVTKADIYYCQKFHYFAIFDDAAETPFQG